MSLLKVQEAFETTVQMVFQFLISNVQKEAGRWLDTYRTIK